MTSSLLFVKCLTSGVHPVQRRRINKNIMFTYQHQFSLNASVSNFWRSPLFKALASSTGLYGFLLCLVWNCMTASVGSAEHRFMDAIKLIEADFCGNWANMVSIWTSQSQLQRMTAVLLVRRSKIGDRAFLESQHQKSAPSLPSFLQRLKTKWFVCIYATGDN